MRDRDEWSKTANASQSVEARAQAALRAAEKAHAAAAKQAQHDYAVYGWHADDTITIAQERKRRKERAESRKDDVRDEIAALSNPRRRNPTTVVHSEGLPARAPRGYVRIYTVPGDDMMATPTRRFDNIVDAVAHAHRVGRHVFVDDVSKERARRYGVV